MYLKRRGSDLNAGQKRQRVYPADTQKSPDVWIAGERVQGAISEHKAFKGLMATQASMYDMQHAEKSQATMVYSSPLTGDPVGLSFKQPKTKKDLELRRQMMEAWASIHHGFLGRSPDYMNTAIWRQADRLRAFLLWKSTFLILYIVVKPSSQDCCP